MTFNNYIIKPTPLFEKELRQVYNYILYDLKEPSIADHFYKKVIREVKTLKFMPEKFQIAHSLKGIHYRKLLVDNYVIIYEVNKDTRTSLHFTYLSW